MLIRRTATVTTSAPEASWQATMTVFDGYFPVPTNRRERKVRPEMTSGSGWVMSLISRQLSVISYQL
jgi:hypothetical protein